MKKILALMLLAALLVSAAGFTGRNSATGRIDSVAAPSSQNTAVPAVTLEQAKAAALEQAGVSEADTVSLRARLDSEDGRTVYEVEFYAGAAEYDFEIDAETGEILSQDIDTESRKTFPERTETSLTPEEAEAIALEDAGVSEEQTVYLFVCLDEEDGTCVYEVEFRADAAEYDYEIDAETGEILSRDLEMESDDVSGEFEGSARTDAETAVSLEQAKAAALEKAGVSAGDITFTETSLDREDGRTVYQIEFVSGTTEYEVEIDAETGAVIEYDEDPADD